MSNPMTAEQYRQHAEVSRKKEPTQTVTLKSGSIFELRRPNLQAWVMTGRVPQSLLESALATWQQQGKVPAQSRQSVRSIATDSAIFFVRLVQYCTVNPKLVEFPQPGTNEIGPETMLDEDFYEIVGWAMGHEGVAGIDGLRSFREGSERGASGDSANGAELGATTVESVAN